MNLEELNLPHYELEVGDDCNDNENFTATSLVYSPATERKIQCFAKQDKPKSVVNVLKFQKMKGTDKMERIISGVLMMPDTKYYRNIEGFEFTVSFTQQELKKALVNYLKSNSANTFDYEHDGSYLSGLVSIEHWVIVDKDTKSPVMGYSLQDLGYTADEIPIGTIMKTVYIESEDFYNQMIVSGNVQGFSIEGFFNLKQILKSDIQDVSQFSTQVKKMFDHLGLAQEIGKLQTKSEEVLSFNKEDITIGEDIAKDGEYILNGKFEKEFKIIIKNGTVVDFGFEETIQEVSDVVQETLVDDKVIVEDVISDVVQEEVIEVQEEVIVDNITDVEVEDKVEEVQEVFDYDKLDAKDKELYDLKKEIEELSKVEEVVEDIIEEVIVDERDAEIEELKAKLLEQKLLHEEKLKSQKIPNISPKTDNKLQENTYIKKIDGVEFQIPITKR